jgi:hypothetical protein
MQNRTAVLLGVVVGAIVGIILTIAAAPRNLKATKEPTLAFVDGKPNLNGVWQAVGTADWNLEAHSAEAGYPGLGTLGAIPPGYGVVDGDGIPYQPSALEKRRENAAKRLTVADPEVKCFLPGVPRATYLPYPFQIIQSTNKIVISYGFANANRVIHLDKAKREPAPLDTWMGRSHGHWMGETLVVDVAGFNGESWLDRSGNFASDALSVEEHYTPIDGSHLLYEATLTDQSVFTRPWKITIPLYRRIEKDFSLLEFNCVEFSEELLYGHLVNRTDQKQ